MKDNEIKNKRWLIIVPILLVGIILVGLVLGQTYATNSNQDNAIGPASSSSNEIQNQVNSTSYANVSPDGLQTGKVPGPAYTPSSEYQTWSSAPSITQKEKDDALSALNASDLFNKYLVYPHGPVNFTWAYPYTGAIHGTVIINSSKYYGQLSFDEENGQVSNVNFINWNLYW